MLHNKKPHTNTIKINVEKMYILLLLERVISQKGQFCKGGKNPETHTQYTLVTGFSERLYTEQDNDHLLAYRYERSICIPD